MEHWVSFPALGWTFSLPQSVAQFTLFGIDFDIRFYGVLIACGFLLAVIYAYLRAPKMGIDRDRMIDVVLVSAVVAVLCARLYYVLFSDPALYFADPARILAIWDGGLAIYGGILGGFGCALLMCRIRKVNTLAMFDLGSLGFLIGQAIGRWGNFFNQEAYGSNTDLPWGMTGDIIQTGFHGVVENQSLAVHPTFLYESLWCALGFLVLHILSKRLYKFNGEIFAGYMIWYGAGRAVIEGFRSDSLYIGAIRVSQLVALLSVIAGVALLFVFRSYAKSKAEKALLAAELGGEDTNAEAADSLSEKEDDHDGAAGAESDSASEDIQPEEEANNGYTD